MPNKRLLIPAFLLGLTLASAFPGLAGSPPPTGVKADKILVEKSERRLTLFSNGRKIKSYEIALGGQPRGHKEREGDLKTPEGLYSIDRRIANSEYHRALRISYPNLDDLIRARDLGVSPGGDIMIHGLLEEANDLGEIHTIFNWTQGCIAVSNEEIEEIWRMVPLGTPVEIRP